MLILTRRRDQSIIIGDHIIISVLAIDGDRIKIGIDAPPSIAIMRGEVVGAVSGENRKASRSPAQRQELVDALRALWPGGSPAAANEPHPSSVGDSLALQLDPARPGQP